MFWNCFMCKRLSYLPILLEVKEKIRNFEYNIRTLMGKNVLETKWCDLLQSIVSAQ